MEILTQLKEWLSELLYHTKDIEDHFKIEERHDWKNQGVPELGYDVEFYTKSNKYRFAVTETYFGCQVSSRKQRAGETWFRGNDLPDGKFDEETWVRMKNAILSYELVKIAKTERDAVDIADNTG